MGLQSIHKVSGRLNFHVKGQRLSARFKSQMQVLIVRKSDV